MAIDIITAQNHVNKYLSEFCSNPIKANWPKYLFHAAPIENACEIIRRGSLCSRNMAGNRIIDVANPGAVENNPLAHEFARLYFRPKNSFHLKTEGIKCRDDPYRQEHHMSIPVMFAFDAVSVLSLEGSEYSGGKMARLNEPHAGTVEFFNAIPFDDVYHDAPPSRDRMDEIHHRRMAEVLIPRSLPLRPYLKVILCRTVLDKVTLVHLLGNDREIVNNIVWTEQIKTSAFLHKGLYVTDLRYSDSSLIMKFHVPDRSPQTGEYVATIKNYDGNNAITHNYSFRIGSMPIRFGGFSDAPYSFWKIELEGVLAFDGPINPAASIVV